MTPENQDKNRKFQIKRLTVIAAVVFAMSVVAFLLPIRPAESQTEKRRLAEFPAFSMEALFSGDYFSGISAWFSDTVPFRDTLTAWNAKIQHILGTGAALSGFNEGVKGDEIPDIPTSPAEPSETASATETTTEEPTVPSTKPAETETQNMQQLSTILVYGNAGYEYYNFNQAASENYAAAVNRAAEIFEGKADVYAMIIPTSMDILLDASVREAVSVSDQKRAIAYMEALFAPSVKKVSIYDTLTAHRDEYIFFRTDHHWTGLGAYYAYTEFCKVKGVDAVKLGDCTYQAFDNFLGSFYTDSGKDPALAATPDTVETYMPKADADITITESSGQTFTGSVIYNAQDSLSQNKYGAFIWGDNPYSVIENHDMAEGESCLLIKESFGNAIAPLLTYNYKYVYIMDYRYCDETAAGLVEKYGITDVFFCNNISMTRADSQVSLLRNHVG